MDAKKAKILRVARLREARDRLGICHAAQGGPVVAHVPFYAAQGQVAELLAAGADSTRTAFASAAQSRSGNLSRGRRGTGRDGRSPNPSPLDHAVQVFERYLGRDLDPAPARRLGSFERS